MSDESHFLTYANVEEKYRKLKENVKFLNETGKSASKICDNHLACICLYNIYFIYLFQLFNLIIYFNYSIYLKKCQYIIIIYN